MQDLIYGYEIKNGLLCVKKSEAKYVRYVLDEYLKGKSQHSIAYYLNANNIPVHKQGGKWTHSMIGLILKNKRYSGDMGYPKIVNKSYQQKAIDMYNNRALSVNKRKAAKRNKDSPFYGMVYCNNCGSKIRLYESDDIRYRKCPRDADKDCLLESELQEMTLDIINTLIADNELIDSINGMTPRVLEITKTENQLNNLIEADNSNLSEINKLLKMKYRSIYMQYTSNHMAESMQLKAYLSDMKKQSVLTRTLLNKVMKKIIFHKDGKVQFILLNSQVIEKSVIYRERRLLCKEQQGQ